VTGGASDLGPGVTLATVRSLYDELRRMQFRADSLRTVEEARAAYESTLAAEDREIEALQRQCDAIALAQRLGRPVIDGLVQPSWPVRPPDPAATHLATTSLEHSIPRPPSPDRRSVKRLVTRYQYMWQLDQSVVARVNMIIDDTERPLGEALSLLDWHIFESSIPRETPADHDRRLAAWHDALVEYRDWLGAEIAMIETRYRGWLGVWERWTAAQAGGEPALQWQHFIEASKMERRAKAERLRAEITSMERALESPRP